MQFTPDLMPNFVTLVAVAAVVGLVCLWIAWILSMGPIRGTLATLCRVGWILPLFLAFFPETMTEQLPRTMTLKPVHVLLDDSASMTRENAAETPSAKADEMLSLVTDECSRLGCIPKVTRLSEQDEDVKAGYTPLSNVLDSWIYKVGADPWLVVTDGGDFKPTEKWHPSLRGAGLPSAPVAAGAPVANNSRALIVGFAPQGRRNVWIKDFDAAPFSFEDKPIVVDVTLGRSDDAEAERVQVQVLTGETALATVNAEFKVGDKEASLSATVPPLPRGQHLLTIRALPTAGEAALWDNTVHAQIEVMPNTVGVLHLLGSPSWDGRFLRRYLKAEPKYDLISFFILRDPWDSQQVNERELSLIPFPVERLFREELSNFRVVVIQNFTLSQFLLAEYQSNLVKFVQEGGGLLFIGGPRSLTPTDLRNSGDMAEDFSSPIGGPGSPGSGRAATLSQILPFEVDQNSLGRDTLIMPDFGDDEEGEMSQPAETSRVSSTGPAYDPDLEFKVELAKPEPAKRSLANVYEDWEALAEPLTSWKTAKGIHHMERVRFKKDTTTILLNAKTSGTGGAKEIPLAVASYPGKGRALWIFSDSLWRLAMTPEAGASRQVYNRFMHGAMTWLMRQDLRKPLVAKGFMLTGGRRRAAGFRVALQGPAARYFEASPDWKVSACGAVVASDKLQVVKHGDGELEISGPLPAVLAGGARCTLEVDGTHPAFGSVKAAITAVYPETFKDEELDAAPQKLEELARLTGANLALPPSDTTEAIRVWLERATGQDGVALPSRFKTLRNFYWVLDRFWFWLLLLLMPLEVVIRKWDQLAGGGRSRDESDGDGDSVGPQAVAGEASR